VSTTQQNNERVLYENGNRKAAFLSYIPYFFLRFSDVALCLHHLLCSPSNARHLKQKGKKGFGDKAT
jgi:hypothetical protein